MTALLALIERAADGEQLTDDELDVLFDELGVSTAEQAVALARARGWFDPVLTPVQHAYLRAFDRVLQREPGADRPARVALTQMLAEATGNKLNPVPKPDQGGT